MSTVTAFHNVRFPTDIALGSAGGPERRTEVLTLGSGHEQRNTRWANSRRRYNAGYGIKTLDDLSEVIVFFEERRGRLHGFRFRDPMDHKSSKPGSAISPIDQWIGEGDGVQAVFQLIKTYGEGDGKWIRIITKPVEGSLKISVEGILQVEGADFELDDTTGQVTFVGGSIPALGSQVYAGFEFDVPVRFEADDITVNMTNFLAGEITTIPLLEIKQ